MYLLKVLNDANEWETVTRLFATEQEAKQHFEGPMEGLDLWADYEIEKLEEPK